MVARKPKVPMDLGQNSLSILCFPLFVLLFSSFVLYSSCSILPLPSASECLYVSDQNGIVGVYRWNDTTNLNSSFIPQASEVQKLPNVGYLPAGLAIDGDTLFVGVKRSITSYKLTDNLSRKPPFVDLAFTGVACNPGGMVVGDSALWVACSAGVSSPLLKFSLLPDDYGTLIANTTDEIAQLGFIFQEFIKLDDANLLVVDLFNNSVFNLTGKMGVVVNNAIPNYVFAVPLSNRSNVISDLFVYVIDPEPDLGAFWYGGAFAEDDNFYLARSYTQNGTGLPVGDVMRFDGYSGEFIDIFIQPSPELVNIFGLDVTPNGDFIVGVGNQVGVSYIFLYDKTTGLKKGTFLAGSIQDDVIPKYLLWGVCPSSPESSSETDIVTIVLATVIPIMSVVLCCLVCLLILVIVALIVFSYVNNRRRLYRVEDDDLERGRRRRRKGAYTYKEIDPDELEIGELLGQGSYGKVYKGTYRGALVAVKTFDHIELATADEDTLNEIREEAQLMEDLGNHPNVISFVGAITNPSQERHKLYFSLVTEYCPNGSLFDLLVKKKTKIPLITLIKMARDIAAGISHLHKEKVIHRDIAARNVLVGKNFAVYISDFGMARIKQQDVDTTNANVGNVGWMAPECMVDKRYSEASDAFAYGVTLWEMVTKQVPWKGMDPTQIILAVAEKNTRLHVPPDADPVLKKIIKGVWEENPSKRTKMGAIVDRLDAYLETLEQLYEEISQDETEGEVFNPVSERYSTRQTLAPMVSSSASSMQSPRRPQERGRGNNYFRNKAESEENNYGVMPDEGRGGKEYNELPSESAMALSAQKVAKAKKDKRGAKDEEENSNNNYDALPKTPRTPKPNNNYQEEDDYQALKVDNDDYAMLGHSINNSDAKGKKKAK